jgi:NTP pyrophosphatase (non-canonical NTP hydrolase)
MLSRYLKDFGEPDSSAPIIDVDDFAGDGISGFSEMPKEPEIDVEAERRDAYSEGHAAATVELTERYELEAQTLAEIHAREIEELKLRYEVEAAAIIASRIRDIAEEVAQLVSAGAAAAIAPVMTEALADKAAESLAVLLREAILEGAAGPIVVRGPSRLFDILQGELGEHAGAVRHLETDDIDLAIELGESVIVTRMSAWAASLKKVLE